MQWQQAMMIGKPSVFDTKAWLDIEPFTDDLPNSVMSSEARKRQARVITRMSRFMISVRNVREQSGDSAVKQEAISLAEELLELCWKVSRCVVFLSLFSLILQT